MKAPKRYPGILITLLIASLLAAPAARADKLTLRQTLDYALEHAPAIESARRSREIAGLELENANVKWFPSLDASAVQGYQGRSSTGLGPGSLSSQLTLTLSENLWDNGESWTRREIARLNRESALLSFARTRDKSLLDVTAAFYRFSLASRLVVVRERQLETIRKQFSEVQGQYQQGLKTRQDYLRFRLQLQRAELDQLAAKDAVQRTVAELQKLIGAPLEEAKPEFVALEPAREPVELPVTPPRLEQTFDARIAKLSDQVNQATESLVSRRRWPQVYVNGEASYGKSGYLGSSGPIASSPDSTWGWNAFLSLRYNLWDWGTRRRDTEIAEQRRLIQSSELRRDLLGLEAELRGLELEFSRVRENLKMAGELLALSEKSLEEMRELYRQGRYSFLDMVNTLQESLDAQIRYYSAYFDALQARAQYRYHEGTLYDALLSEAGTPAK